MNARGGRFRLSVLHLALAIPWVGLVLGSRRPVRDNSFLWHVEAGRLQLGNGTVLVHDPFSYTRFGEPWRTQSWMVELLYGRLDSWFGLDAVPWIMIVVMALTIAVVMVTAWTRTHSLAVVGVTGILTTWIASIFVNPRPVVFSYLLLSMVVLALVARRLQWVLPAVIWVWAGVHGSFVIGIGVVVLDAWSRRQWGRGIRWGIGLSGAAMLTAHGIGVWEMLLSFARSRRALDLITEWAAPDFVSLGLVPFVLGISLLLVAAIDGRIDGADLWLIVPMLILGFSASRSVLPAWLVLVPFVASGVAATRIQTLRPPSRTVNLVLLPILIIAPLLVPNSTGLDPNRFPIEAADCVDSKRRLFHTDIVGGYLIFDGAEIPVFVDDRAELYGEDIFRDVLEVRNGVPGWQDTLEDYEISQVLIERDAPVVDDLAAQGWSPRYESDDWILMDSQSGPSCVK